MSDMDSPEEVRLGAQGRLVVPARIRRVLGLRQGDALIARTEEGRLILEKADATKRRLKSRFAAVAKGKSLARELIAERRVEAKREARK